jgi:hypothetical protein
VLAVWGDILITMPEFRFKRTLKINHKRTFGKWFKGNKKRFRNQPLLIKKQWNHIEFKFQGLSPRLHCIIDQTGATIWVMHHKEVWDVLAEFDIWTGRKAWGDYYCTLCSPETREFFPSKQALWENHCLEKFLKWINDNLVESHWVALFQIEGCTWVELKREEEIETMRAKKEFIEAFPIVPKGRQSSRRGRADYCPDA